MTIAVVGLNYRTTPVEIREKLTLAADALPLALADLREDSQLSAVPDLDEVVILSTCNRLELYVSTAQPDEVPVFVEQFLAERQSVAFTELKRYLYNQVGDAAIQHLMRVACGLESMILGETQILGQVTQAYEIAHQSGTTGPVLSHLFAQAIHTGKRARTETAISRHTTSVSHAGALLLLEKLDQPQRARVVIVGAGEMATQAAQALQRLKINDLTFINRTYGRAEALAHDIGGRALQWSQLGEALTWADGVICATSAPYTVIKRQDMEAVLPQREKRPLVLIDIAVPRDVEAAVRELRNVQVYDIDDLQSVVDAHLERRKAALPQVETIIQQEMARFAEWYHSRQIMPVIRTLREWAQNIADDELAHTLNRLSDADDRTREVVSRMAHRLVNRLLHEPTARLRFQASEGNGYGYAQAVRELFALDDLDAIACSQAEVGCALAGQTTNLCTLQCLRPPTMGQ